MKDMRGKPPRKYPRFYNIFGFKPKTGLRKGSGADWGGANNIEIFNYQPDVCVCVGACVCVLRWWNHVHESFLQIWFLCFMLEQVDASRE